MLARHGRKGDELMKNRWYGDVKDHVKWQSLLQIARAARVGRIFYIAMRTEDLQVGNLVSSLEGGPEVDADIRAGVNNYFRSYNVIELIRPLGAVFGIQIEVETRRFTNGNRGDYFAYVVRRIRASDERTVWFFDPDTGMETAGGDVTVAHVALEELAGAFEAMPRGDWLVCFQNSWRDGDWRTQARQRFAVCLGIGLDQVDVYASQNPRGVIMLAARKA